MIGLSSGSPPTTITTGALDDGDPNTGSCGTPDKPMKAGDGTLPITP
jgi:hypothetical protein